ncbi:hypothetical protein U9M48_014204, partial [Paspalum notatum var. saurae]
PLAGSSGATATVALHLCIHFLFAATARRHGPRTEASEARAPVPVRSCLGGRGAWHTPASRSRHASSVVISLSLQSQLSIAGGPESAPRHLLLHRPGSLRQQTAAPPPLASEEKGFRMAGVGVEQPADAAAAAAAGLRPRRPSAKRSWPPGCGRSPAHADGHREKRADTGAGVLGGPADEAVAQATISSPVQNDALALQQGPNKVAETTAPAAVAPVDQNGALPQQQQGLEKEEEAATPVAVSPVAETGALPQQQPQVVDKVEQAATHVAISPVAQNGALPPQVVAPVAILPVLQNGASQQEENKAEELVVLTAVSDAAHNSALPCALPYLGPERAGENGEALLLRDAGEQALDLQEGNRAVPEQVEVSAPTVSVLESCGIVGAASSMQNGEVGREEVAIDGDVMEMGNKTGGVELEKKENGVAGSRPKRWLRSVLNPPPKKRVVSAVRKFPPGCGRTAVVTEGSGVLEVSPIRSFPPGCGRNAVTTTNNGVSEVSPVCSLPPGCGRSAVNTADDGDAAGRSLEAAPVNNGDSLGEVLGLEGAASPMLALEASNEKLEGKRLVDEGHSKAHSGVQVLDDFVGTKQDCGQRNVAKTMPRNVSHEKMEGKLSQHEGKQLARGVVDEKMRNKPKGSFQRSDAIDAKTKGKRLESDKRNTPLLGNLDASIGGKIQCKTLSTKKELCSNENVKQKKIARKLKVDDGIDKDNLHRSPKESKIGKLVATNQTEKNDDANLVPDQIIVLGLMAPDKCPWSRGRKSIASASKSLASRKKSKEKDAIKRNFHLEKVASYDDEIMENNDDSNLEDNSKALVVYGEKREICVTVLPSVPPGLHRMQPGDHDVDARSKVKKLLRLFQATYRKLMQVEEQGARKVGNGRVDLEAAKALKNDPIYKNLGAVVGNIPGVEVGDEFHFRVELHIVGLHRSLQAGIDTSKVNGVLVATSIVASGGYPDELSSSNELIYTGSGGKAGGNKEGGDQKLERGNLALKNCIKTKTPVRVIHGFKGQNRSEVGHSKGKQTSTFTYDGLYEVVECWQEGPIGERVFKYKLQRIAGQPELALHAVKATRMSKVREGLCLPDISQGIERIPICVINTIDDMRPAPFKYITKVIYPTWYEKEPPKGCNCTNGCSDSVSCACAVKNLGEIPFNFDGAIVEARPLIYECGPSCRCPPTCHNRVSQHGIKIPLEIFKTGKTGWGVRSLCSISSGSFICEYTGELLEEKEAEKRQNNDEYLFDIGSNYHDEELWKGLKSVVGAQSSASSSKTMEGFTIDAAECGNVGRFINHSCSPNLYAQNVLWDHDDIRRPHVMFFAAENIPPLQELTYHYNYKVGTVLDENGEEKVKHCYCCASDCCGRLY